MRGERGTSLVVAMSFLSIFGLISIAILGFGDVSLRATAGYRNQRAQNYATDAALQAAINRVRHDPSIGRDPGVYSSDVCNPTNTTSALINIPATSTSPAMVVSCQVESGGASGLPKDLGTNPPYSILTLGDRRTDQLNGTPLLGHTNDIGVRNTEPGPYNGVIDQGWGDPCGGNRQESGIRVNKSMSPFFIFGYPIFCTTSEAASSWNVTGNVFANSPITLDEPNSGPVMVTAPDTTQGTIKARGGCVGTGLTCTNPGWGPLANNEGDDPGLLNPTDYAPRSLAGLTVQSIPTDTGCKAANRLVSFNPGIYTDATALNNLFADADCANATFWFQPGAYYFDFRNTDTISFACGGDINASWIGTLTQDSTHQWCVGGKGQEYAGQRVIGGTPYNWDPQADPTTHEVTLAPAGSAGNGTGFWSFLQNTQFINGANAKAIDGTTASMAMTSGHPGSSIWLSDYQDVPRGAYGLGLTLEVAHSALNVDRMNAPTVSVNWGQLFGGGTCGPYTLAKPPSDGSIATVTLSPADTANLTACLNNGDKINTAVVQYNVSRPWNQGAPYPTAKLDGARFQLTTQDQPTFPRPPSATDPGGDCDPAAPGAQFIFGGDSHLYVPNGGLEVCAGPNPTDEGNGKQIAVYGVPATPRLVPTAVTSTSSGVTTPSNALRIAEGSGLAPAYIPYSGNEVLRFPGYTTPTGYSIAKVELRASYNPQSATPTFQVQTTSGSTFCGPTTAQNVAGNKAYVYDVTPCMTASNHLASAYDVKWNVGSASGSCSGVTCPQLDGIELIVTLQPTDPNTTLRPQYGCITVSANFWYGVAAPDCALLKVDAPFWDELPGRRGRLSIKGTVYAPSAAIDIDDTDVNYPLASRGLIARHLRIRGFQYASGYSEPAFSNWIDTTASARQVLFYVCGKSSGVCKDDDTTRKGRAAVTFEAVTSTPTVTNWSVSED
jgi:hypothetical protein